MVLLLLVAPLALTPLSGSAPDVEAAVARAVERLVEIQENLTDAEGAAREWPYEGVYREAGEIPPGYRVGGTAIAAWALLEAPGYAGDAPRRAAVERALDFVLERLEEDPRMAQGFRGTYDVRGWGQAYALEFLLRLEHHEAVPEGQEERVARTVERLVDALEADAIAETGGWNYARGGGAEDPRAGASPFMTAPTVLALARARSAGHEVDGAVLARALEALERGLVEDGITAYNTGRGGRDTAPGSTGRLPVTWLALGLAGEVDGAQREAALERAVQLFLEHWAELEKRRRQNGTHLPPHGIAPYYFFYAHLYAAFAIEELPRAKRREYRARFLERLFEVREDSGGWNDRVFDRSENYGTATALLALLAPDIDRLPGR